MTNKIDRDYIVVEYSRELTKILNNLRFKNKTDPEIEELLNSYSIVRDNQPELIVIYSGPYVWHYREHIGKGDLSFILRANFEEEIKNILQTQIDTVIREDDIRKGRYVLQAVKKVWHLCNDREKEDFTKRFQLLLKLYATFIKMEKAALYDSHS